MARILPPDTLVEQADERGKEASMPEPVTMQIFSDYV
jgi:hypothetical protein